MSPSADASASVVSLDDLLCCPRCAQSSLRRQASSFHCAACSATFPDVGGVPWLFPEPQAALADWRQRTQFLFEHLAREAKRLREELHGDGLRASTRSRLKLLASAYEDQVRRLRALLAPIGVDSPAASYETYAALRTRLPESQGLTSYYANVHRDWCWGEEENEASYALVASAFEGAAPGAMLVLGAGAGRLSFDLHRRLSPAFTIAADVNPLLVLAGAKIMAGEKVSLYEFPIAPRSVEEHAVLRTLSSATRNRPGFHFVFADAMHAPFRAACFESIVTPWFVDIIPEDFAQLARRINQQLAPGGRWINFGSLAFAQAQSALCYSLEETLELLAEAGFEITHRTEAPIPYMRSPASRHGRVESVVTFAARKVRACEAPAPYTAMPDWIVTGTQPVPLLPAFESTALSTRIHAFIMSLIDGKRSLRDMARVLVEQRLMSADDAEPALRGFLIKMYEEARQPRGF